LSLLGLWASALFDGYSLRCHTAGIQKTFDFCEMGN
jgi:hypothetical protein